MISQLNYKPRLGKSDHLILEFNYNCYIKQSLSTIKKFIYFKGNYKTINQTLNNISWTETMQGLSLAEAWKILTEKIIKLVEEQIPVSKGSGGSLKKNPYVNHQSITAIKKKHTNWLKYQHCKTNENYTQYKIARNAAISELRKSKYSYEKDLAAKIKTDSKLFWSYVRSKTKTKSNTGQLEMPDGSYTNEDNEKAEILNNYFASVFADEVSEVLPNFEERNFGETLSNF